MHGTGTALGDPIETNATLQVLRPGPLSTQIRLLATKAQVGHAEAAAGAVSMAAALEVASRACGNFNPHLSAVNPYVRQPMEDCKGGAAHLLRQAGGFGFEDKSGRCILSLSAFAFQGTNAHAITENWDPSPSRVHITGSFHARDAHELERQYVVPRAHRLVRSCQGDAGAVGKVALLVDLGSEHAAPIKDHVVQGKPILPGAAMLETALGGAHLVQAGDGQQCPVLSTVVIPAPFELSKEGPCLAQLVYDTATGAVELRGMPSGASHGGASRLHLRGAVTVVGPSQAGADPKLPSGTGAVHTRSALSVVIQAQRPPPAPAAGHICCAELDLSVLGVSTEDYFMHPSALDCVIQSGLTQVRGASCVPASASAFCAPVPGHARQPTVHGTFRVSATISHAPTGGALVSTFTTGAADPVPGTSSGAVLSQLVSKRIDFRKASKLAAAATPVGTALQQPEGQRTTGEPVIVAFQETLLVSLPSGDPQARDADDVSLDVFAWPGRGSGVPAAQLRITGRNPTSTTLSALRTTADALPPGSVLRLRGDGWDSAGEVQRGSRGALAGMMRVAATEARGVEWDLPQRHGALSHIAPVLRHALAASESMAGGTAMVTGGLGSLGLLLASRLAPSVAATLLTSRTGRSLAGSSGDPSAALLGTLAQSPSLTALARCDTAVTEDVGAAQAACTALGGWSRVVLHAAGVLRDAAIRNQTHGHMRAVAAPKGVSLRSLACGPASPCEPLDCLMALSSISALVGFPGQANYAAANSSMDATTTALRWHGSPAVSLQLGAVREVGMAARSAGMDVVGKAEAWGLGAVQPAHLVSAIARTVEAVSAAGRVPVVVILSPLAPETIRAKLPRFASRHTFEPVQASPPKPAQEAGRLDGAGGDVAAAPDSALDERDSRPARYRPVVMETVREVLKAVTGRVFDIGDTIAAAGIGQLRMLRLVQKLRQEFDLVEINEAMIKAHEDLPRLAKAISDKLPPEWVPVSNDWDSPSKNSTRPFLAHTAPPRPTSAASARDSPGPRHVRAWGHAVQSVPGSPMAAAPGCVPAPGYPGVWGPPPAAAGDTPAPAHRLSRSFSGGFLPKPPGSAGPGRSRPRGVHAMSSTGGTPLRPRITEEADVGAPSWHGAEVESAGLGDLCGWDADVGRWPSRPPPGVHVRRGLFGSLGGEPGMRGVERDAGEGNAMAEGGWAGDGGTSDGHDGVGAAGTDAAAGAEEAAAREARIRAGVVEAVRAVTGQDPKDGVSLAESGVDSLGMTEFARALERAFPGLKVPETLPFDYPTLSDVVHFVFKALPAPAATTRPAQAGAQRRVHSTPGREARTTAARGSLHSPLATNSRARAGREHGRPAGNHGVPWSMPSRALPVHVPPSSEVGAGTVLALVPAQLPGMPGPVFVLQPVPGHEARLARSMSMDLEDPNRSWGHSNGDPWASEAEDEDLLTRPRVRERSRNYSTAGSGAATPARMAFRPRTASLYLKESYAATRTEDSAAYQVDGAAGQATQSTWAMHASRMSDTAGHESWQYRASPYRSHGEAAGWGRAGVADHPAGYGGGVARERGYPQGAGFTPRRGNEKASPAGKKFLHPGNFMGSIPIPESPGGGSETRERARAAVSAALLKVVGQKLEDGDSLMSNGVDSLSAVEVASAINEELGLELPETLAFDYPTLGDVVQYVAGQLACKGN